MNTFQTLTNAERARLYDLARMQAVLLRTRAVDDFWATIGRVVQGLCRAAVQRPTQGSRRTEGQSPISNGV